MTLPSSLRKKEVEEEQQPIQGLPSSMRPKKSKDSFLKSSARTAYQIPSGIAQTKTYPLDLLQMAGLGHAIDPEEIEHLRKIHEREGIPFDEEKYLQGVQQASETFPTQGNIERMIEEETGAPLTTRNKLQKAVKLGSGAAKLTPGSFLQKGVAGVGAPIVSEGLQELGLPEILSDITGLGGASIAASQIPGKITAGIVKKPSGLTSRRFEDINKKTLVSPKKIGKINEKIENEFRGLAENIIEKSPIKETHSALKNDAQFKNNAKEAFKDVSKLSEQLPEKFSTEEVAKELINQAFKKSKKGFSDSEFDKAHERFVKDFSKKFNKKEINAKELVEQYRKNNESLAEAYEPGQSFAYNKAKRQALTDFNKAIAETIDKKFPDSEMSNLFKETNKKWSQIMDAESIDKFFDKMFDGKIKFEKGRQFFDKQGMTVPFERALGKDGFKDFSQLMNDLMSYEQASKLMKSAESKGFTDLVKTGKAYLIHPKLGLLKTGIGIAKDTYKKVYESLLDKPKISIKWDKGVKAFKKGDFKEAEKIFNEIDKEIKSTENIIPTTKDKLKSEQPSFFHGTQNEFEEFGVTNDLGYHFSKDPETAKIFATEGEEIGRSGRIIEANLDLKNPIEMPDMAGWYPTNVAEWIDNKGLTAFKRKGHDLGELEGKVLKILEKYGSGSEKGEKEAGKLIKDFLKGLGYDGIQYINKFEGKPIESFIVFEPKQISQKNVKKI